MRPLERLRALWLRWETLVFAAVLALPFVVLAALGGVWLWQEGWLLPFALVTAALVGSVRLVHWAVRVVGRQKPQAGQEPLAEGAGPLRASATRAAQGESAEPLSEAAVPLGRGDLPASSSAWSEAEKEAFFRARARIRAELTQAVDWAELPKRTLAVVESVALDLSGGKRGALSFTAPEALLLVERLAGQARRLLLEHVPFADRISIEALWWLWQRRNAGLALARTGWLVWRGVRFLLNPTTALLRELEGRLAARLQDRLGAALTFELQRRLLEEAATLAVDLYSGRLRFSEQELLNIRLADDERDAAPQEEPTLRIVLVGQLGVGKSALFNALLGEARAEVDAAPTTARAEAALWPLAGGVVRLFDTPGLDGSRERTATVAALAAEADLVVWVFRADRPDRSPDHRLRHALAEAIGPSRRAPPIIPVLAAIDLILPGWPWPEHDLPQSARARIETALKALADDWLEPAIPISLSPKWNLENLEATLVAALPEARLVALGRRRAALAQENRFSLELRRAVRGARRLSREAGATLLRHFFWNRS